MSPPDARKTIRVTAELHKVVHDLADSLHTTAEGALRHLTDPHTVRVHLSPQQFERWNVAAGWAGMPLSRFAEQRVEAALQYGIDPETLLLIRDTLREIRAVLPRPVQTGTVEQPPKEN